MKYKIPKGSVQETLLIPLYGRKMAMDLYPDLFADRDCQELLDKIDFEAPKMSGIKARIGAVMAATRQFDMAEVCRRYLKDHPNAVVVNLGCAMAELFPGGRLVFDATNARGLKNMLKTWLKPSEMENVGLYFSVDDEQELVAWSKNFATVTRKGYMTGYRPLDKRYGFIANTIFRFGDKRNMCQIIEIAFKK